MEMLTGQSENIERPTGIPLCGGVASAAIPEASSRQQADALKQGCPPTLSLPQHDFSLKVPSSMLSWYVLRATYGREKLAGDFITAHSPDVEVFWPTQEVTKLIDGHRRNVIESLIPNIFFARGSEKVLQGFVYDNGNLPFLRFYYGRHRNASGIEVRAPLVVPDYQMRSFRTIYESMQDDLIFTPGNIDKFREGQLVRVVRGVFKGVIGRVARYKGQQRVGVIINGLLTAATAYIPSSHLEIIEE